MKVEKLVSYSGFAQSCLLNTRTFLGSPEKRQKCEIMCLKKRACCVIFINCVAQLNSLLANRSFQAKIANRKIDRGKFKCLSS